MISLYIVSAIFVVVLLHRISSFFNGSTKLKGKIPPGPNDLPFIGTFLRFTNKNAFTAIREIAEECGDVCSFQTGPTKSYVITDLKLAKEIFAEAAFAGRLNPGGGLNDMFANGQLHGITNTNGEQWEEIRRFTLRQLRDFGFGKASMESLIMDELNEVLTWIKLQEGKSVDNIKKKFIVAGVNALWSIISGQRYKHDDPRVVHLTSNVISVMDEVLNSKKGLTLMALPWIKNYLPNWSGYNIIREKIEKFRETFTTAVSEHKNSYEPEFQRDFIDVFLKEISLCKDTKSAFFEEFGERNLVGVIADLFMAGTDTSSITLEWALLYLCSFKNVQNKLQEEVDRVVGKSRPCGVADRPHMPYTQAVLSEILRFSSITPLGVPHVALSDRDFQGWAIPAGTGIWVNQYSIHKSKAIWGDPEEFRPERFLSPDGKTFQKHEALISFSMGRRQCAGETLARDTLFLYITNIFQRFEVMFDLCDPKANPGLTPVAAVFLMPQPFKIIFKERV